MKKAVLITGSSTGIGRATAELFASQGWNVAASMRKPERSADWSRQHGIFCTAIDVTDTHSIAGGIRASLERFGRIDVLVNNAGYALMGPLEGCHPEAFKRQFDTNVNGLVEVTRAILPHFRDQKGGTVVNVASIGGRMSFPLASAYHASKWAVDGLSESLMFELRPFDIRVKVVEPGGIRTDFISRGTEWVEHPAYSQLIASMREISAGADVRLPGPEGVARAIFRAANDRSGRLRFPVHHQPYMLLRQLLPDSLWLRVVGSVLRNASRPAAARHGAKVT